MLQSVMFKSSFFASIREKSKMSPTMFNKILLENRAGSRYSVFIHYGNSKFKASSSIFREEFIGVLSSWETEDNILVLNSSVY